MFADDSECIKELLSPQDSAFLQINLDSMVEWGTACCMRGNASKSAFLRFSPQILPTAYTVHSDPIPLRTSHRNLRALITNDFSWSTHIAYILSKAYRSLRLIRSVVPFGSPIDLKKSLYLSLVRCYLVHLFGGRIY